MALQVGIGLFCLGDGGAVVGGGGAAAGAVGLGGEEADGGGVAYRRKKNEVSIDGLPTGLRDSGIGMVFRGRVR